MKLRIRGDSLRLRLTQSEVQALGDTKSVSETIHFGPGRSLEYRLELAGVDAPTASFEAECVRVQLPEAAARRWVESEEVGIEHDQPLPEGALRLLIEKDFQCLAPREGEDDSDAFPHPGAESGAAC